MKWIGLTGSIGTGKSTVARILRDNGFQVIDADELAREALQKGSPGLRSVIKKFGSSIMTKDGDLDRKALASLVFQNKEGLRVLEEITHPIVRKLAEKKRKSLEAKGEKIAFYDVPLLFEKNMESQFDEVIVVASSAENQIRRLKENRGWSDKQIADRLANQLPLAEKIARADFVIHNDSSLEELKAKVLKGARDIFQST